MKLGYIKVILLLAVAGVMANGCGTSSQMTSPKQTQQSSLAAQEQPDWFFDDIVDAAFVAAHISTPMDPDVMIIDARPKRAKYDHGHIPMAVSISDIEFEKHTDKLPQNKDALLIYYCEGLKCKLSHKSAAKARKLGYTNVKVFAEGFPKWMEIPGNYAAVSVDWVAAQLENGTPMLLVDSRPKRTKFDKGHIPGAISIPDSEFDKFSLLLPQDKNAQLVFYCGGLKCKLSHKSAAKAIALGYTNVKVFSEGYPSWKAMIGDSGAVASLPALKSGKEEGSIDIELFKEIVTQRPESVLLIDVRDADEFAKGSFKTAVNIPVDDLEGKIKTLPEDKPIIFVCGTGARSGESFYMLQDLRPELKKVYYLDAELTLHKDGSFEIKKVNQ